MSRDHQAQQRRAVHGHRPSAADRHATTATTTGGQVMTAPAQSNQWVRGISTEVPHLSHSRVSKYLHCPEQYRLYYVENLRPRIPDAGLVFGQIIHQALAALFRSGEDPVSFFLKAWQEIESVDVNYGERESWARLQ